MRRLGRLTAGMLAIGAIWAASAQAEFGINAFDVQIAAKPAASLDWTSTSSEGGHFSQAGGHPYAVINHIEWNHHPDPIDDVEYGGLPVPDGDIKDTFVDLPPGMVGNPTAVGTCTAKELYGERADNPGTDPSECPAETQVGLVHLRIPLLQSQTAASLTFPLFNMVAPSGSPARFGFKVSFTPIYLDASLRQDGSYAVTVGPKDAPQALRIFGSDVVIWGNPSDPRHDAQRCNQGGLGIHGSQTEVACAGEPGELEDPHPGGAAVPFLTMPTSCTAAGEGQAWKVHSDSWDNPGAFSHASVDTHLPPYAPEPGPPGEEEGTTGCGKVPFNPDFSTQPSQQSAASPSGLIVGLTFPQDGLLNQDGIAQSHLKKAVVRLPEGVTVNPSQAEGLGICTPDQYEAASLRSFGCPSTARIGSVVVHTPLLEDDLEGNVYIAQPDDPSTSAHGAENPFDSLIALYIVIRNPERGIAVKLPGKVEPDPNMGQLVATFDDLPQVPFSDFQFKFREGPRAPLITPNRCGTYTTQADFYPWARPNSPVHTSSSFEITSGPGGGPCPLGNIPPFHPGFSAGTANNNAGSYSPFLMRLTRQDGEQDMTKFSALLPPGVSAKIAGLSKCGEDAIAVAREKTGIEERESPSCPASSQIGTILAGAGVGSTLVYVPGKLYLAGPYNGAPLSALVITPAVAGPFDVGTVIVREALSLDPRTAEVHVDGDRSDPIPHILKGIPLNVRDIRVNVDRPDFTINPTSCDPSQVGATLFGSFLDLLSPADDVPVSLASRFQAASCQSLGFKPALSLKLSGGTKRGDFPVLKAELRPRKGDANLRDAVVTLPRSAFLEQGHIRTICTRVQYAAKACPTGSIYGHVTAWTPLLDTPLDGPVYLRSSNHKLPDLVLSLHGVVDIEAVGRIDSINGQIRSSFESTPDAPLSKVILTMQGGQKGLIVNSRGLCGKPSKANAELSGQNAKAHDFHPTVTSSCRKAKKRHDHKPTQR